MSGDMGVPFSGVCCASSLDQDVCMAPRKGTRRIIRILAYFYLLPTLPCLSMGSLQTERGPSVPGSLLNAAFLECLLEARSKYCVAVRGLSGLGQCTDSVGSWQPTQGHPSLGALPAWETLPPCRHNCGR